MNNIEKWLNLKLLSGSHSPSIETIRSSFADLNIKVDACFLSNPYATSLFFDYVKRDLLGYPENLMRLLEYYPSQNRFLANLISNVIGVDSNNIFVSNGAIEGIEKIFQGLNGSISIPIPTFSSYYEFARPDLKVYLFQLEKSNDYKLNLDKYQEFISINNINNILIINPNNPTGHGFCLDEIELFLSNNQGAKSIIVDESFYHFNDFNDPNLSSCVRLINKYPNLYVVKSLSKDFGIAGIRLGYVVSNDFWVKQTLKFGGLWNVNGISEYFLKLFSDILFQKQYEESRVRFLAEHINFGIKLSQIGSIKVLPSTANFYLVELLGDHSLDSLVADLVFNHGIYVRNCSDKIGLEGNYIRIATRTEKENDYVIEILNKIL